jgi:hypothetical protein
MPVAEEHAVPLELETERVWFCSDFCRQRVMGQCIALNASFFNTHRMVRQYMAHAYLLEQES